MSHRDLNTAPIPQLFVVWFPFLGGENPSESGFLRQGHPDNVLGSPLLNI
jgi:hypothetical protein